MTDQGRGDVPTDLTARILEALGFDPAAPEKAHLLSLLYTPDSRLPDRIAEIDAELTRHETTPLTRPERTALGYKLEELLLLVFQNLAHAKTIASYQSAAAQHDFLIDGDSADTVWLAVCRALYIGGQDRPGTGLLIEAKAGEDSMADHDVQRLGNILTHYFERTVGMAVIVALAGISGAPESGKPRASGVRAAHLTQLLVYHSLRKPVVVLDWEDLKTLTQPGSLVRVLGAKVRELEQLSGLKQRPNEPTRIDVPERMRPLVKLTATPAPTTPTGPPAPPAPAAPPAPSTPAAPAAPAPPAPAAPPVDP